MSERTCDLCGEPVRPGEKTVGQVRTWEDVTTGEVKSERWPTGRVAHRRCVLALQVAERWDQ
jgi:hypothetical protein